MPQEEKPYGPYACHANHAVGDEPDECVLSFGTPEDCDFATFPNGRVRKRPDSCPHWKRVKPKTA